MAARDDRPALGRRPAAMGAEVGAARERRSALAPRHPAHASGRRGGRDEDRVELVDPIFDRDHLRGALEQELGPEAIAPVHLDGQPADVPDRLLSPAHERAALAAEAARVRHALERASGVDVGRNPAVAGGWRRRGRRTPPE
jgi:hypothetical protein